MKTALALVPAAVILLGGCAGTEAPGAASAAGSASEAGSSPATDPAATGPAAGSTGGTASVTGPALPSATASATAAASDAVPTAMPTTYIDVNKTIDDPELKESITVKRIARQLPWPAGYKASAQAYELLAVEMTWTPSKDYTIPIRWFDFSINSGTQFPNAPDGIANDAVRAAGWTLLPGSVGGGDPVTGWIVFKVDPRNAQKVFLDYNRPATKVTGGASFAARTLWTQLVG